MPRTSGAALRGEVVKEPQQALFAAAKNYKIGKSSTSDAPHGENKDRYSGESWQVEAWRFYDTIGEYHYAVNWVGNLLSRAKLIVVDADGKKVDNERSRAACESLFGGTEGQAEMLRQLGIQFTVAGEAYIAGIDSDPEEDDNWFVVAATQVRREGDTIRLWDETFEDGNLLIRLWRPHPAFYRRPDSPTRSVLGILEEILQLTKHVSAQIDSRLAGAGLLLLPNEVSFPSKPSSTTDENGEEQETEVDSADAFVNELIEVMSTAIKDRGDASALVPIVLQVPSDALEKIQHLKFWTELDEKSVELRTEAIRRLSLGLDMPPEVLTGTGDLNHWGAWQVDEAAIKSHSEPLLKVITSALSSGYLRPFLVSMGMNEDEARSYSFAADTSGLRMRPNRSKESLELFDRGELSAEATLRENGFSSDDAPSEEERSKWLTRKVAGGSTTPEIVLAALRQAGVQLEAYDGEQVQVKETQEERPTRSLTEHPTRDIPDQDSSLTAAAEMMVYRALERAGNRLKNKIGGREVDCPAPDLYLQMPKLKKAEVDDLLTDAWSSVGRFDYGVDSDKLAESLHSYTASLISLRKPMDRDTLRSHLSHLKEQ